MKSVLAFITLMLFSPPVYFYFLWKFLPFWQRHREGYFYLMAFFTVAVITPPLWLLYQGTAEYAVCFPLPMHIAGLGLIIFAAGIFFRAAGKITLPVRMFLPFFKKDIAVELKTDGIYGIIRHPMYASPYPFIAGAFLVVGHPLLIVLFLYWATTCPWFCRQEEKHLREIVGSRQYDAYARKVPMLVPWVRRKPRC